MAAAITLGEILFLDFNGGDGRYKCMPSFTLAHSRCETPLALGCFGAPLVSLLQLVVPGTCVCRQKLSQPNINHEIQRAQNSNTHVRFFSKAATTTTPGWEQKDHRRSPPSPGDEEIPLASPSLSPSCLTCRDAAHSVALVAVQRSCALVAAQRAK